MKGKMLFKITKIVLLTGMLISNYAYSLDGFNVEYKIKKGIITVGKISRNFEITGDKFKFESTFETTGVTSFLKRRLYELSEGQIVEKELIPSSYLRETTEKRKNFTLKFENQATTVKRIDLKDGYVSTENTTIQDKLSYQAQLMLDFGNGKYSLKQEQLEFFIAAQNEIEKYEIENLGFKDIKTPLGNFTTLVLNRKVKNSKKEDTVYLAPELNWLPIRIDHLDKKGRKMIAIIEKKSSN